MTALGESIGSFLRVGANQIDIFSAKGRSTGIRKDGGYPKGSKNPDPRGWEPNGHRPGFLILMVRLGCLLINF